jgi:hypothetical protein
MYMFVLAFEESIRVGGTIIQVIHLNSRLLGIERRSGSPTLSTFATILPSKWLREDQY